MLRHYGRREMAAAFRSAELIAQLTAEREQLVAELDVVESDAAWAGRL